MKVQTSRNKEHTCLIFLIEKVKAHTNIHFIFVKLCKKPIKIKKDISSVPRVRKLVVKTQQWHILYIVWSLLTLYRVLHGDQKHRKRFCTKDNAKKMQRCVHAAFTPHGPTELCRSQISWREQNQSAQRARRTAGKIPNESEHNKRRDAFHDKRLSEKKRTKEPPNTSARWTQERAERQARWSADRWTRGCGKVMCKNLNWAISLFPPYSPPLSFSFSPSALNACYP